MKAVGRPQVGNLTVPFIVDEHRQPIDFKVLDPDHVDRCAKHRRCGICGSRIQHGRPLAFVGPDDDRTCFADPWMHPECGALAMAQCPFLRGTRDWRDPEAPDASLVSAYPRNMVLRLATDARSHRGPAGEWHFEAIGPLEPLA